MAGRWMLDRAPAEEVCSTGKQGAMAHGLQVLKLLKASDALY